MGAKEGQQEEEEEEETDNTRRARVREGKRAAQHGDFCSSFFFGDFTTHDTHTHTKKTKIVFGFPKVSVLFFYYTFINEQ